MTERLRLISAVLWTLIILVLCWTPDIYLPVKEGPSYLSLVLPIPLDKVVHAGIFLVFVVLWMRALGGRQRWFVWLLIAGAALAVISELGQNLPIVHRDGEIQDALADCLGLILGIPAFLIIEKVLERLAFRSSAILQPSPKS